MVESKQASGYFRNGVPYNRLGHGSRTLVVFRGLQFEHKPLTGLSARLTLGMFNFAPEEYTTYVLTPKSGLPVGYAMGDMADDYASVVRGGLTPPVDVLGTSTGGSIAQHFAADHPELVRRLVLHASAHVLADAAKEAQMRTGQLAGQGKWREASAVLLSFVLSTNRFGKIMAAMGSVLMSSTAPDDASDLIVTIKAEDAHDFRDRLAQIQAPTLVIAGDQDPFYSETLFRETAQGIPSARLILYPGKGHAPAGKRFSQDVLAFLRAE